MIEIRPEWNIPPEWLSPSPELAASMARMMERIKKEADSE